MFETPFKRKRIDNDNYLTQVIKYIHQNPQKHLFVSDFRDYPHSSYLSFLSNRKTKLARKEVLTWFGDEKMFTQSHLSIEDLNDDWMVEV